MNSHIATRDPVRSLAAGQPLPRRRTPQTGERASLPPDTIVVSADSHWSITEDIWLDAFPERLRDRAPTVWHADDVWHVGVKGRSFVQESNEFFASFEPVPGATQIEPRLRDMDAEGVDKEIVFPNAANGLLFYGSDEVRTLVFDTYNEYIASVGRTAPGRFFGAALMNYWDPTAATACVQRIVDLGLKTVFLPQAPRRIDKEPVLYQDAEWDPLWAAIGEAGLPICFHIGESVVPGPGGLSATLLANMRPFRKNFGELVFGGVLDRHPELQIVFVEANLNWIPGMLQDAELCLDSFHGIADPLELRPSEYWYRNFYATVMTDRIGLTMLDEIGTDRVMFGADYPHCESTFGYNWTAMRAIQDATSPDEARQILGGNAMRVFDL